VSVVAVTSAAGAVSTTAKAWTSSVISCSVGTSVYWADTVCAAIMRQILVCAKDEQL
jgi:hypothetical protein